MIIARLNDLCVAGWCGEDHGFDVTRMMTHPINAIRLSRSK